MASESNLVPGWNAHRHPQEPLRYPDYLMEDVPKCRKDFEGSIVQRLDNRDHFKECMAEMVLLCNEAIRRAGNSSSSNNSSHKTKLKASKPLSLEYIADRVDVDDPCFGYVVRHEETGMMQGFITVTTFTNWQKSFEWNSRHEMAFYYDHEDDEDEDENNEGNGDASSANGGSSENLNQGNKSTPRSRSSSMSTSPSSKLTPPADRAFDQDGSLADKLQATVRLGDPYNEGIVWPRLAEISLLGALGCGQALINLVLEDLEMLKASATRNYDYCILQATDNSIPFYEKQGFVRVGAVVEDPDVAKQRTMDLSSSSSPSSDAGSSTSTATETSRSSSPAMSTSSSASDVVEAVVDVVNNDSSSANKLPQSPQTLAMPSSIVSSSLFIYQVTKKGETPQDIAKAHNVNVWDIIFLNKDIYRDIQPRSRLMQDTILHIPNHYQSASKDDFRKNAPPTQWFVAKENDTPKKIAKQFGVPCNKLVLANMTRLPGLTATARLKEGTRIKVTNLDHPEDNLVPYCHWTFPDDSGVEGGEPSYMMARPLDRRGSRHPKPTHLALGSKIQDYLPPKALLPAPPKARQVKLPPKYPPPPQKPAPPPTGYDIFTKQQLGIDPSMSKKDLLDKWNNDIGKRKQDRYQIVADESEAGKLYPQRLEEYEVALSLWEEECDAMPPRYVDAKDTNLFSKVVKLSADAKAGKEFKYWYVLTYIPDLKWCHLAPLVQDGVFGPERKRSQGRPKWRLVDESLGKELDISSQFCIPIKARDIKKTIDADKEEWDVVDDGSPPLPATIPRKRSPVKTTPKAQRNQSSASKAKKSSEKKRRSATKPTANSAVVPKPSRKPPKARAPLDETFASFAGFGNAKTLMTGRRRRTCQRCRKFGGEFGQTCNGSKGCWGEKGCQYFTPVGKPLPGPTPPASDEAKTPALTSPTRSTRNKPATIMDSPATSTRGAQSDGVYSPPAPSRRARLTSPMANPRVSPRGRKRGPEEQALSPARKLRKVNSAGARRSVLQN